MSELFKDKPEGSKRISQNKETEVLDFKATLLEVQKYGVLYIYYMQCVCTAVRVCGMCYWLQLCLTLPVRVGDAEKRNRS